MDVKQILKLAHLSNDAVLIEGKHGIGKSQQVKQYAKQNNYHLEELFLSHQEVGDLIGIPHTIEKDGESVTVWSKPVWLQRMEKANKEGKHCVLFLDELNRAQPDVLQSALQLVLERQIHEHKLPEKDGLKTLVVAAINPADEYQVLELDPALTDRFLYITVEPDTAEWLKYAREKNISRVIRDYIAEHPDHLHYTPQDGSIGSSPRSWEKLDAYLKVMKNVDKEILFTVIKGRLGSEVATTFYQYYESYKDKISVEDIEKIVNDNRDRISMEELENILKEIVQKLEPIQQTELAHQLKEKYINKEDMLPYVAFLYALPLEVLTGILKSFKNEDFDNYMKLAEYDDKVNNKELFKRILRMNKEK
jgi:hypothetical protein